VTEKVPEKDIWRWFTENFSAEEIEEMLEDTALMTEQFLEERFPSAKPKG
jgi:hypothetical protein